MQPARRKPEGIELVSHKADNTQPDQNGKYTVMGADGLGRKRKRGGSTSDQNCETNTSLEDAQFDRVTLAGYFPQTLLSPPSLASSSPLPPQVSPELMVYPLKSDNFRNLNDPMRVESNAKVTFPPKLKEGMTEIASKVQMSASENGQSAFVKDGEKAKAFHSSRAYPSTGDNPSEFSATNGGLLDLLKKRDTELMQQFERMRSLNGQNNGFTQNLQNKSKAANGSIDALFGQIEWIRKLRHGAFLVHDQMLVRLADAEEAVDILRKENELTRHDYKRLIARMRAKHNNQLAKTRVQQVEAIENIRQKHSATLELLQLEMDKKETEIKRMRQERQEDACVSQNGDANKGKMQCDENLCERKLGSSSLHQDHMSQTDEETKKAALAIKTLEAKLTKSDELLEQLEGKLNEANRTIKVLREESRSAERGHCREVSEINEKHSHQLAELSSSKEEIIEQIRQNCNGALTEKKELLERLKLEHESALRELGEKLSAKSIDLQRVETSLSEEKARACSLESQLSAVQCHCNDEKDQLRQKLDQVEKDRRDLLDELAKKKLIIEQLEKEHAKKIAEPSSAHSSRVQSITMAKDTAIGALRAALIKDIRGTTNEQSSRVYDVEAVLEKEEDHDQSLDQTACTSIKADHAVPDNAKIQNSSAKEVQNPPTSAVLDPAKDSVIVHRKNSDIEVSNISTVSEEAFHIPHCGRASAVNVETHELYSPERKQYSATNEQSQSHPDLDETPEEADESAAREGKGEDDCELKERIDMLLQSAVPKEVTSRFRQVVFAEWMGRWLPAIELGPYDVTPGSMRKHWLAMAEKHATTGSPMKHLVYWYGVRNMMEAYSFLHPSHIITYEEGVRRGYDEIPAKIQAKLESQGGEGKKMRRLSPSEKIRVNALLEIRWEAKLEPSRRLAWAKWD